MLRRALADLRKTGYLKTRNSSTVIYEDVRRRRIGSTRIRTFDKPVRFVEAAEKGIEPPITFYKVVRLVREQYSKHLVDFVDDLKLLVEDGALREDLYVANFTDFDSAVEKGLERE